MITFEFVRKEPYVFKTDKALVTENCAEVALELKIPQTLLASEGADKLQARIKEAVEKMVGDLNRGS